METIKNSKIWYKYSKEQNLYVKPLAQMQHLCAIKYFRSANVLNFLNKATVAICIVCKPVVNTQTLNSTGKAASNPNLGQDVNVLEYNTLVKVILL